MSSPPESMWREGIFWAAFDLGTTRAAIQRVDVPEEGAETPEAAALVAAWLDNHGHPFADDEAAMAWVSDRALLIGADGPVTQACRVAMVALAYAQQDRSPDQQTPEAPEYVPEFWRVGGAS